LPGLELSFSQTIAEISAIAKVAEPFIHPPSLGALDRFVDRLQSIRNSPETDTYPVSIDDKYPLLTRLSKGEYEPGGGGRTVFGEIVCISTIRPLGMHSTKFWPKRTFRMEGLVTTRLRVMDAETNSEVARWHHDIAQASTPFYTVHTQFQSKKDDNAFPASLPIPRLPGLMITLGDSIEFLLAELFQTEWTKHVARDTAQLKEWRSIQKDRFIRFLTWESDCLKGCSVGTPWNLLKAKSPPASLFYAK
jgi:hypothetical protein